MLAASAGTSPCISSVHAVMLLLLQSQFASSNRKTLSSQCILTAFKWHLLKVHFVCRLFFKLVLQTVFLKSFIGRDHGE